MCRRSDLVQGELSSHVQILDHVFEFLEADSSIIIEVGFNNGAVHELLQLHVGQIVANHHLQHCEELAICNEPIFVKIVDFEGKPQFLFFVITV
jgi:hypothetical protein